jgi:hypothetical protein
MLINPCLREAREALILEHSMIAEVKVKIVMPPLLADLSTLRLVAVCR